jgi:hypothetical protein
MCLSWYIRLEVVSANINNDGSITPPYDRALNGTSACFKCGVPAEGVNELEEREEQLPSWNRRRGPKGPGW